SRRRNQLPPKRDASSPPVLPYGPAPLLRAPSFPPRQGIFRCPILNLRIRESRNVRARRFRTRQASAWFLLALLPPFRGRCGLPATEIQLYAGTTASAFPSARCCTIG